MTRIAPVFSSPDLTNTNSGTFVDSIVGSISSQNRWVQIDMSQACRIRDVRTYYSSAANSHSTLISQLFAGGIELHRSDVKGGRTTSSQAANRIIAERWTPFADAAFDSVMMYGFVVCMIHPQLGIPVVIDPCNYRVEVCETYGVTSYRVLDQERSFGSGITASYIKDIVVFELSAPLRNGRLRSSYASILDNIGHYDVVRHVSADAYMRASAPTVLIQSVSTDATQQELFHDHTAPGDYSRTNQQTHSAVVQERAQRQIRANMERLHGQHMMIQTPDGGGHGGGLPPAVLRSSTEPFSTGGATLLALAPDTRVSSVVHPTIPPSVTEFENTLLKTFAQMYGIVPLWADSSGMREYLGEAIMQVIRCTQLTHARTIVSIIEPMLQHALIVDCMSDVGDLEIHPQEEESEENKTPPTPEEDIARFVDLVNHARSFSVVLPGNLPQGTILELYGAGLMEHKACVALMARANNMDPAVFAKEHMNPQSGIPVRVEQEREDAKALASTAETPKSSAKRPAPKSKNDRDAKRRRKKE